MLVHKERELKLRAYAVGARNEHGVGHIGDVKLEKTAKAAYIGGLIGDNGSCYVSLHKLYRLVACGYINACACVSLGFGIRVHF